MALLEKIKHILAFATAKLRIKIHPTKLNFAMSIFVCIFARQKQREKQRGRSIARPLRVGGKSGQLEPPCFLTGRGREGNRVVIDSATEKIPPLRFKPKRVELPEGRLIEAVGDGGTRLMIEHDRTRLTGALFF